MKRAAFALGLLLGLPSGARGLTGAEVYEQACASCHGPDGRGAAEGSGLSVPLPDFTDCAVVTTETTANWAGLVRHGGRFLGLSDQMPSFGDALSETEIRAVVDHLRGFCERPGYPPGDLNYRRLVFVEKAFPEDELVGTFERESVRHERIAAGELAIEKRLGARDQVELALPGAIVDPDGGRRTLGGGDVAVGWKHVVLAAPQWRSIVAAGTELVLPTGNRRHGIGSGTTLVVPQLFSGQGLGPLVVQTQVRAELAADTARAPRQMLYRVGLQWPLGPYKKNLVPALELEQSHALDAAIHGATVLGPSLYLPLSRRGHVAIGVGALLPVAGRRPFNWVLGSFLLWEYRDGPFWAW